MATRRPGQRLPAEHDAAYFHHGLLALLELRRVTRSFGETRAVQDVDLRIEAGATTVLIGPSGCGKSTLLRLMNGLLLPDAGEVRFDGMPMAADNLLAIRHRMGYVVQDGGLFPHLTARRNITLMAGYLGWAPARRARRLETLVQLTRFPADALDRFPAELSGGQAQRVALMRALMLEAEVLLLDEPLGALDPMVRSDLQEDLQQIFATLGATVVLVTHDLTEAAHFADAVVLMRSGRIIQQGPVSDILESPADDFVRRFVSAQRPPAWPAVRGES